MGEGVELLGSVRFRPRYGGLLALSKARTAFCRGTGYLARVETSTAAPTPSPVVDIVIQPRLGMRRYVRSTGGRAIGHSTRTKQRARKRRGDLSMPQFRKPIPSLSPLSLLPGDSGLQVSRAVLAIANSIIAITTPQKRVTICRVAHPCTRSDRRRRKLGKGSPIASTERKTGRADTLHSCSPPSPASLVLSFVVLSGQYPPPPSLHTCSRRAATPVLRGMTGGRL